MLTLGCLDHAQLALHGCVACGKGVVGRTRVLQLPGQLAGLALERMCLLLRGLLALL